MIQNTLFFNYYLKIMIKRKKNTLLEFIDSINCNENIMIKEIISKNL